MDDDDDEEEKVDVSVDDALVNMLKRSIIANHRPKGFHRRNLALNSKL